MFVLGFLFWLALAGLVGYVASERNRSAGGWALISLVFTPLIGLLALIAAGEAEPNQKEKPNQKNEKHIPITPPRKSGNPQEKRKCMRANETPFPASYDTCPCCGTPVEDGEHPLV